MALEHKLSPIYDALDAYNFKFALNQCNKMLKKQPTNLVVKALKSLAMERMGQSEEALAICKEVIAQKPFDDATLQATVMTLRSMSNHELIIQMYTNAAEARPGDEELLNHLFMAYTRAHNYKGQQQVASNLNKYWKSNRYLFWYIASLIQQGAFGKELAERAFAMTLAERFLKKCLDEGRIESIDELKLFVIALEVQEKYKEAYDFLQTEWGDKFKVASEGDHLKLKFAVHLELWDDVFLLCKKLIVADSNDWDSSKMLVEATFRLSAENPAKVDEARELVSSLIEKNESTPTRGPFLLELELLRSLPQNSETTLIMIDRIVGYFKRFGHKLCCFEDLKPYLSSLDQTHSQQTLEMLKDAIKRETKEPIDKNYQQICVEKFMRTLNKDPEDLEALIETCDNSWQAYIGALEFGAALEATERQHGDDFALLTAHRLFACYQASKNMIYITQAIICLEKALERSTFNFQFKLLLIRLYLHLGAFHAALGIYQGMDIKYILNDTVGYFLIDHVNNLGSYVTGPPFLGHALTIYSNNRRETPEMICQAFKHSTVAKVLEFVRFQHRLENSLQRIITEHEQLRSDVLSAASLIVDGKELGLKFDLLPDDILNFSEEFLGSLRDNRDRNTMNSWEPVGDQTVEFQTRPECARDTKWIQIRAMILFVIKAIRSGKTAEMDAFEKSLNAFDCNGLPVRDVCLFKLSQIASFTLLKNEDIAGFIAGLQEFKAALLPTNDLLNYETIANTSVLLEILIYGYVCIVSMKSKPESRKAIVRIVGEVKQWLLQRQKWVNDMSISAESTALKNRLVLSGATEPQDFVPLFNLVIDQANEPLVQRVLGDKIVESWRRSLKQLVDLTSNIENNFK